MQGVFCPAQPMLSPELHVTREGVCVGGDCSGAAEGAAEGPEEGAAEGAAGPAGVLPPLLPPVVPVVVDTGDLLLLLAYGLYTPPVVVTVSLRAPAIERSASMPPPALAQGAVRATTGCNRIN
jgi:hypothetical protein